MSPAVKVHQVLYALSFRIVLRAKINLLIGLYLSDIFSITVFQVLFKLWISPCFDKIRNTYFAFTKTTTSLSILRVSLSFSKDPVQVMVAPGNAKSIFILSPSTTHWAGIFSLLDASRAAVLSAKNSITVFQWLQESTCRPDLKMYHYIPQKRVNIRLRKTQQ